jgi:hypothetical protein
MEDMEIGTAAGTVWRCLQDNGTMGLSQLKKETKLNDQLFFMALGWLAREDKVQFGKSGRTATVALKMVA